MVCRADERSQLGRGVSPHLPPLLVQLRHKGRPGVPWALNAVETRVAGRHLRDPEAHCSFVKEGKQGYSTSTWTERLSQTRGTTSDRGKMGGLASRALRRDSRRADLGDLWEPTYWFKFVKG